MTTHPFDKLELDNGAAVIFTPCPGTKAAQLQDSVAQLKAAGAAAVVSAMYDAELEKLGASELENVCEANQLDWYQFPLADDAPPNDDFTQAYKNHITQLVALLASKKAIAVHCKGGSGRTGLTIALVLVALGLSKEAAKAQVQAMRPKALTHPAQLAFFEAFEV